jgi:hypothetical protein
LEPDGITLATVLAIELAILATTPFLELRFFAPVVFFDLGCGFDLDLVFAFVFAAFLAINDSATASSLHNQGVALGWHGRPFGAWPKIP